MWDLPRRLSDGPSFFFGSIVSEMRGGTVLVWNPFCSVSMHVSLDDMHPYRQLPESGLVLEYLQLGLTWHNTSSVLCNVVVLVVCVSLGGGWQRGW